MRITYGKNVYGKEEISAVVKQLKKTTQMSDSVRGWEKIWLDGKFRVFGSHSSYGFD